MVTPTPKYPLTEVDILRTLPDLGLLDPRTISFDDHVQQMLDFAQAQPVGTVWRDYFSTTDGRLVLEWIAGVSALNLYHNLMRIREQTLDTALNTANVTELAFSKGMLLPPTRAPELTLTLTIPTDGTIIELGQLVATLGKYEVFSLESKTVNAGTATLRCVVGNLNTWTMSIPGFGPFRTYKFLTEDPYPASQLEQLTIDGVTVPVTSEASLQDAETTILRRTLDGQVRIYAGNGVAGYADLNATSLTYQVLSYGDDINTAIRSKPALLFEAAITNVVINNQAESRPSREEVRHAAIFYPTDGRIVTDTDYETKILQYHGGIVLDVVSYNTDPDQYIILLTDANYGTTDSEKAANLDAIQQTINNQRGLGISVIYEVRDISDPSGVNWTPTLYVDKKDLSVTLQTKINTLLNTRRLKMFRSAVTLDPRDLASEMSAKFQVMMTADDNAPNVTVPQFGFLNQHYVTLAPRS